MPVALEVRNLVKHYNGVKAVDGVSFAVREGICFGLLGPNGAGKTTTIEIIEGVNSATSGEILYYGRQSDQRFLEETGIQFQNTALQDYLTVRETLEMFAGLYDRRADIDEIIERCSLGDLKSRDNRKLSGGQRQRLFLAIAIVNQPKLIFLDEPTTGLDPQSRRNFWDLVTDIRSRGTTVMLTTHYMDEAEVLCDEIVIMDAGKIVTQGNPAELLRQHYRNVIIELPIDDVSGDLEALQPRVLETAGIIEIDTDDVNGCLRYLASHAEGLDRMKIRRPNLEDLFLDLTGHALRS